MFSYYFPPQYSGAAVQAINLSKKLRERGLHISFLTVNHDGLPEEETLEGFKVFRLTEGGGKHGELVLWRNMWNFLKEFRSSFDIIHSHGANFRNSVIGPFSKMLKKKSLVKISLAHNDLYGLGNGKSGWLHKRFIFLIDRYVSMSNKITREMNAYGLNKDKIREIPNGVDCDRFSPQTYLDREKTRAAFGFPEKDLMLLYAGVVDERKNVKGLVQIWNTVSRNYRAFLVVVGPVSREDKNQRLYDELKKYERELSGKLFFVEQTDNIGLFYNMADIFVLPSINEGLPNVMLEAMASGLPCLANKVSGTEDVINSDNGILFNISESASFLNGLKRLGEPSTRVAIGKKARETAVKHFSLESIADRYMDLYIEMLGK
jgi:glycosyltransferase involved in cell wall biosynthesis